MKIILASHGQLAKELINSAEMICGKQEEVSIIEFIPGEDLCKLKQKFSECMDDSAESLIITDVFGGTPYNVAAGIALQNEHCLTIAGASLPMLLDVFMLRCEENISIQELANRILSNSTQYVRSCQELSYLSESEEL
ncbi:PTS sugar transporter subunit IIA [Pectinatus cerevisiiphilus]|uniref:PTS system mannose-specific IIA component n=1 Tax=Pectinatus cerevisiiphilus TaxID=86956 RepID=A0A4R3K246_9FIRM|nr:PTS sugar transporter subunit IIA [Pectinatus cerevisiiphilus]TCS76159.1 PTS system mannose-specific IIA component [Pectinatus cerevisiiphilus]